LLLARAPREHQQSLRALLTGETCSELAELRAAPIIINWNPHPDAQPLAVLRRVRRGAADHALTLIRSDGGPAFELSPICFDAVWGMAMAEILTGCAAALHPLAASTRSARAAPAVPLTLATTSAFNTAAQTAIAEMPAEAAAETGAVDLRVITQ